MLVAAILDDFEVESCGDCCELSLSACSRIGREVKKLWRRLKGCACMCCCDYSRSDIKHFLGGLYVVIMVRRAGARPTRRTCLTASFVSAVFHGSSIAGLVVFCCF